MKIYERGFTLIEMMLVLVIIGGIIFMGINYFQQRTMQLRIERTATQMQQILNAGLAFYIAEGRWPNNIDELRGKYLPYAKLPNPWFVSTTNPDLNQPIFSDYGATQWNQSPANFYVWKGIVTEDGQQTLNAANAIAGLLPNSYLTRDAKGGFPIDGTPPLEPNPGNDVAACKDVTKGCIVVASVTIPGQNLNNARAVNFAGLYRQGGCVPVPQCPLGMKPQIIVAPTSVSGFTGLTGGPTGSANYKQTVPITSITAYAKGGTDKTPPGCLPDWVPAPPANPNCADPANNDGPVAEKYWRACVQIMTDRGEVSINNQWAGKFLSVMAITRCAVENEPAGTKFNVFGR